MRAITIDGFGANNTLQITEQPDPNPGPDTVVIRTHAVGVNPVDWKIVRGYLASMIPHHFPLIACLDVAGTVQAVGAAITEFQPGDEVMAYNRQDHVQCGTLAELTPVPVRCIAHKPAELSWERAAALPLAGLTAYQVIQTALDIRRGETVLVHAAAGGVGSLAVQLATLQGARVLGTASPQNHEYLRSIGAEPIDYHDDVTSIVQSLSPGGVDAIFDLIGGETLAQSPALLKSTGRLASVVDAKKVKELGGTYVFVRPNGEQLAELGHLAAKGSLQIDVSKTFPFEQAVAAFDLVEARHVRGKVVIAVK